MISKQKIYQKLIDIHFAVDKSDAISSAVKLGNQNKTEAKEHYTNIVNPRQKIQDKANKRIEKNLEVKNKKIEEKARELAQNAYNAGDQEKGDRIMAGSLKYKEKNERLADDLKIGSNSPKGQLKDISNIERKGGPTTKAQKELIDNKDFIVASTYRPTNTNTMSVKELQKFKGRGTYNNPYKNMEDKTQENKKNSENFYKTPVTQNQVNETEKDIQQATTNANGNASQTQQNQNNNNNQNNNEEQKERTNTEAQKMHEKNMESLESYKNLEKSVGDNYVSKETKEDIKEGEKNRLQAKSLYETGRKRGIWNKINPFGGYIGMGKAGMLAGAAIGAMSNYKRAMDKWRAQAAYNASIGLPPPRRPGMFTSMASGAVKGGIGGAVIGNVGKVFLKPVHENMINSQKNAMLDDERYTSALEKSTEAFKSAKNRIGKDHEQAQNFITKASDIINNGGKLDSQQISYIQNNYKLLKQRGWLDGTPFENADKDPMFLKANLKKLYGQNFSNNLRDYLHNTFDYSLYLHQCFSLYEDLVERNVIEIDELTELYNAYAALGNEDVPPLKEFLQECVMYESFPAYIKDLISYRKRLEYVDENINFSLDENLIKDLEPDISRYKVYKQYYLMYQKQFGTKLSEKDFCYRCHKFNHFFNYIRNKLLYKMLYEENNKGIEVYFAITSHGNTIQTTDMPENVKVIGPNTPDNQSVVDEAQMNEQQMKTADTQQQLGNKNQKKQHEIHNQDKKNLDQAKINQAEQVAKQKVENIKNKLQNKLAKTQHKRQRIAEETAKEKKNLPPEALAAKGQEITNLNLKEQQHKAEAQAKINNIEQKIKEQKQKRSA